ncbi:orotate phosphoribosyltransferase [bacterium]|nr:orotate phosphoribosyltransferase [bacterium]
MSSDWVREKFEKAEALLTGHFLLSSGNHSNCYLQCALVTQYPGLARELADRLAAKLANKEIDVVLGPAVGGIVFAQEMAQALSRQSCPDIRAIFCERVDGKMALRRGFSLKPGEKVLAVEDVITTGGSVKEAIALAKTFDVTIIGVASLVDRSATAPDLGAPLTALMKVQADIYSPEKCPLCRQGIPAVKPGSRGLK